jgi:hypothetical protein
MHRILLCLLVCACAAQPVTPPAQPPSPPRAVKEGPTPKGQRDLEALASFFPGNWDAKAGAEAPMRVRVGEFWRGGTVRWFYLEWVSLKDDTRPTRQLVFRVAEDGEQLMTTTVYRLPEPARFVGEWRRASPFASIGPADLKLVEGCRLTTVRTLTAHFVATTDGNACPGDLKGVPYMRFEFSIASSEMTLLEQPRHAAGNVRENTRLDPYQLGRMSREPK